MLIAWQLHYWTPFTPPSRRLEFPLIRADGHPPQAPRTSQSSSDSVTSSATYPISEGTLDFKIKMASNHSMSKFCLVGWPSVIHDAFSSAWGFSIWYAPSFLISTSRWVSNPFLFLTGVYVVLFGCCTYTLWQQKVVRRTLFVITSILFFLASADIIVTIYFFFRFVVKSSQTTSPTHTGTHETWNRTLEVKFAVYVVAKYVFRSLYWISYSTILTTRK